MYVVDAAPESGDRPECEATPDRRVINRRRLDALVVNPGRVLNLPAKQSPLEVCELSGSSSKISK